MKLSEKLQKKEKTLYQRVAERHGVTVGYVTMIANSVRKAKRGKGLAIRTELEKLVNESENETIK